MAKAVSAKPESSGSIPRVTGAGGAGGGGVSSKDPVEFVLFILIFLAQSGDGPEARGTSDRK